MDREVEKTNQMVEALKARNLTPCTSVGYGSRNEYKPIDDGREHRYITVLTEDGQVCAEIKMLHGYGYRYNFSGWRVSLPTYKPRGSYNVRQNRLDPTYSGYWGWAKMKSADEVARKVEAAIGSLPSSAKIEAAKLRSKMDVVTNEARNAQLLRASCLSNKRVTDEIHEILTGPVGTECVLSEGLAEGLRNYGEARSAEERLTEERSKLWNRILELEDQG